MFALLLLLGEQQAVPFSPQSAGERSGERVLSASGSAALGHGERPASDRAPAHPAPAGPKSLLSPRHLSRKIYRGLKYACSFFLEKKKKAANPCLHPVPSLSRSTSLTAFDFLCGTLFLPLLPRLPVPTLPSLRRAPVHVLAGSLPQQGRLLSIHWERAWSEGPALKCALKREAPPEKCAGYIARGLSDI